MPVQLQANRLKANYLHVPPSHFGGGQVPGIQPEVCACTVSDSPISASAKQIAPMEGIRTISHDDLGIEGTPTIGARNIRSETDAGANGIAGI